MYAADDAWRTGPHGGPRGDGCDADSDGGCWSRCWRPAAAPLTLTSPRAATTPTSGSPSTWFPTCSDQRHLGPGRRPAHRPQAGPLAGTINRQSRADLQQSQGWLEDRGLAAYAPQRDANRRKETDLSRLSEVRGAGFDRAFVKVMLARDRTGLRLAAVEARDGAIPEFRTLAPQMTADLLAQLEQLTALLGA